ncbi:flagellar export chaperone FliS [Saccharibacillus sp. CPCC 101409]|uniref:flagellar export chaperone FliS n=1 Tax=Saccharibacillus sp. CPCC 101409 TaxID=3058041 RepID=UPI002671CEB9|nr:flagellar export chaperone FliS [Saccharibacillus sp. CPCC 101409]MDO3412073.1 flagellar export chaperone FliS [Saccharibacillus sp. CPCC 101409]
MMNSPYERYRQTAVQTSPAQLLIMTYDGAIRFVKTALEGMEAHDNEKTNLFLGKAQTIIAELITTLDRSYEISKTLYSLYEYMNYLLIQANIKKTKEPAEEALQYLRDLKETWVQASRLAAANPTPSVGTAVNV